jgi:hypothetical protein
MIRIWVLLAGLVLFVPTVDAEVYGVEPWWGQPLPGGPWLLVAEPGSLVVGLLPDYHVDVPPEGGLLAPIHDVLDWGNALDPMQIQSGAAVDLSAQIAECLSAVQGIPGAGSQSAHLMAQRSAGMHETLNSLPVPAGTGVFMAQ